MMKELNHAYFGNLNLDVETYGDVLWEQFVGDTEVTLWYEEDVEDIEAVLDGFAAFLTKLEDYVCKSRKHLIEYLEQDRFYIEDHIENLPEENYPTDAEAFVEKMVLPKLSLWLSAEQSIIRMDFMISPELSDQILCVEFDHKGSFLDIAWES